MATSPDRDPDRLAAVIPTGFLGAGKTTLLNRILRAPGLSRTLVIVNEFGEVGLDHLLIETPADETILLSNGCLCCSVLGDLVLTLSRVIARRDAGELPPVERVVIETTVLCRPDADPADAACECRDRRTLKLACVITVADALNGLEQLDSRFEAVKQAAAADRIVISKADLAPARRGRRACSNASAAWRRERRFRWPVRVFRCRGTGQDRASAERALPRLDRQS